MDFLKYIYHEYLFFNHLTLNGDYNNKPFAVLYKQYDNWPALKVLCYVSIE